MKTEVMGSESDIFGYHFFFTEPQNKKWLETPKKKIPKVWRPLVGAVCEIMILATSTASRLQVRGGP